MREMEIKKTTMDELNMVTGGGGIVIKKERRPGKKVKPLTPPKYELVVRDDDDCIPASEVDTEFIPV